MVIGKIVGAVRFANRMQGRHPEFFFHRPDENIKTIQEQRIRLRYHGRDIRVYQRAENQRPDTVAGPLHIDLLDRRLGLVDGVDKGQGDLIKGHHFELS